MFMDNHVSLSNALQVQKQIEPEEMQEMYTIQPQDRLPYYNVPNPAYYPFSPEIELENEYLHFRQNKNRQEETERHYLHNNCVNSFNDAELELIEEVLKDIDKSKISSENTLLSRRCNKEFKRSSNVTVQEYLNSHVIGIYNSDSYCINEEQKCSELLQIQSISDFREDYLYSDAENETSESFDYNSLETTISRVHKQSNQRNKNLNRTSSVIDTNPIQNLVSNMENSQTLKSSLGVRHVTENSSTLPWLSLNLPATKSTIKLINEVDANDVLRAMKNILKMPIEDLIKADKDGDTMLMCLVGNPKEAVKKKAYLLPLVDRLSTVKGALSFINNHGQDALYLSSMNCPQIPEITGYLAATMLRKGIDIGQRLYHIKGDTLLHAAASRGDTHKNVLKELLELKTLHGNTVFDVSKRNYDGKTALHLATEAHNLEGISAIETVSLLLEHGVDPCVTDTKSGNTALHIALSRNWDMEFIQTLLSKGDKAVNVANYDGNTSLHIAVLRNATSLNKQEEMFNCLVQAGGNMNVLNHEGKTPFELLRYSGKDGFEKYF